MVFSNLGDIIQTSPPHLTLSPSIIVVSGYNIAFHLFELLQTKLRLTDKKVGPSMLGSPYAAGGRCVTSDQPPKERVAM